MARARGLQHAQWCAVHAHTLGAVRTMHRASGLFHVLKKLQLFAVLLCMSAVCVCVCVCVCVSS